jgi:hypothetical protein
MTLHRKNVCLWSLNGVSFTVCNTRRFGYCKSVVRSNGKPHTFNFYLRFAKSLVPSQTAYLRFRSLRNFMQSLTHLCACLSDVWWGITSMCTPVFGRVSPSVSEARLDVASYPVNELCPLGFHVAAQRCVWKSSHSIQQGSFYFSLSLGHKPFAAGTRICCIFTVMLVLFNGIV